MCKRQFYIKAASPVMLVIGGWWLAVQGCGVAVCRGHGPLVQVAVPAIVAIRAKHMPVNTVHDLVRGHGPPAKRYFNCAVRV